MIYVIYIYVYEYVYVYVYIYSLYPPDIWPSPGCPLSCQGSCSPMTSHLPTLMLLTRTWDPAGDQKMGTLSADIPSLVMVIDLSAWTEIDVATYCEVRFRIRADDTIYRVMVHGHTCMKASWNPAAGDFHGSCWFAEGFQVSRVAFAWYSSVLGWFHPFLIFIFFLVTRGPDLKVIDRDCDLTQVASFSTVQSFWKLWNHMSWGPELPV